MAGRVAAAAIKNPQPVPHPAGGGKGAPVRPAYILTEGPATLLGGGSRLHRHSAV
jgi:hypothetical protein